MTGLSAQEIEDFEQALGAKLPKRFAEALREANGAEWDFARHDGPFVPPSFATMTREELWRHLLSPLVVSSGTDDVAFDEFLGRYLPIGDDYSGEIVLVDLQSAPFFRVLSSNGEGYQRVAHYQEIAATFDDYCDSDGQEPERVAEPRPPGVTSDHVVKSVPTDRFGSALFRTGDVPTLVTVAGDVLVATQYKNLYLVNDATAAIGPQRVHESPLGSDRCKATYVRPTILIYETSYRTFTQPNLGGVVEAAVVVLLDGAVRTLKLTVQGLTSAEEGEKTLASLLARGMDWFKEP